MILEGILNVIKAIVLFIIGLMPTFPNMTSWINTNLTPLFDVIISANYFVDIRLLAGCLITVVAISNIEFVWSGLMWVIKKIPGVE